MKNTYAEHIRPNGGADHARARVPRLLRGRYAVDGSGAIQNPHLHQGKICRKKSRSTHSTPGHQPDTSSYERLSNPIRRMSQSLPGAASTSGQPRRQKPKWSSTSYRPSETGHRRKKKNAWCGLCWNCPVVSSRYYEKSLLAVVKVSVGRRVTRARRFSTVMFGRVGSLGSEVSLLFSLSLCLPEEVIAVMGRKSPCLSSGWGALKRAPIHNSKGAVNWLSSKVAYWWPPTNA